MITVGLPLYKMKDIAWIAFESLCNQVNAPEWELLVIQEKEDAFDFTSYEVALEEANCKEIKHIELNEWMPLGDKWVELVKIAKGEIFILQSGDCYSQPNRLRETWELRNFDWIQSQRGLFYDIETRKTILYNQATYSHPCGLNMAFRTELGERLKKDGQKIFVDSWLYKSLRPLRVGYNNSDSWLLGLDTNGKNKLSQRERYFNKPTPPFSETDLKPAQNIIDLIDENITFNQ